VFKTKHHLKIHLCKGKSQCKISDISPQKSSEDQDTYDTDDPNGTVFSSSSLKLIRPVRKRSKEQNYTIHRLHEGVLEMPLA